MPTTRTTRSSGLNPRQQPVTDNTVPPRPERRPFQPSDAVRYTPSALLITLPLHSGDLRYAHACRHVPASFHTCSRGGRRFGRKLARLDSTNFRNFGPKLGSSNPHVPGSSPGGGTRHRHDNGRRNSTWCGSSPRSTASSTASPPPRPASAAVSDSTLRTVAPPMPTTRSPR